MLGGGNPSMLIVFVSLDPYSGKYAYTCIPLESITKPTNMYRKSVVINVTTTTRTLYLFHCTVKCDSNSCLVFSIMCPYFLINNKKITKPPWAKKCPYSYRFIFGTLSTCHGTMHTPILYRC